MDKDKAAIQMDVVGWKVVAPNGETFNNLDIGKAVCKLMHCNYPNSHPDNAITLERPEHTIQRVYGRG